MVSLNIKNFSNLIGKLFIFVLGSILVYFILFWLGYVVNNNTQALNVISDSQKYTYILNPLLGTGVFFISLISMIILYTVVMIILSLIVNFLWKRNIIEFTDNTRKDGFFEKILEYAWLFLD